MKNDFVSTNGMDKLLADCEIAIAERKNWEGLELAASNKRLYGILERCYTIYKNATLTKEARKELAEAARHLKISVTPTTPSAITVIKIVFGDEPRWRASVYGQVLRIADAQHIGHSEFAKWLGKNGGVEKVRKGLPSTSQAERDTKKAKAFGAGLAKLEKLGVAATLEPTRSLKSVGIGLFLMLGRVEADGSTKIYCTVGKPDSDQVKSIVRSLGTNATGADDPDGINPGQFAYCGSEVTVDREQREFNNQGLPSTEESIASIVSSATTDASDARSAA